MKKIYCTLLISLTISLTSFAQHTFSIVAVDPATGEIGSAGATCIAEEDGALAISDIVLGVGAIHTQSFYVPANQNNARTRMEAGDSPQEIIDWLIENDVSNNASTRQYGVVDLNGGSPRAAAFTGADCFEEFIHVTGENYAIQGNILISEAVVNDMETAFLNTNGTLADKLMAAMQGAKRPGADSRCLSSGISSASAFIRVADPDDTDSSYGNLSLDLNVWITNDVFEPIDALQTMYDETLLSITEIELTEAVVLAPNPVNDFLTVQSKSGTLFSHYEIFDVSGKLVLSSQANTPTNRIVIGVQEFVSGIYFINLYDGSANLGVKRFVVE